MSRQTYESWLPEEWGGPVISKIGEVSAVEGLARVEQMSYDTKHVPRSAGTAYAPVIAKGGTYTEATGTHDTVDLTALKFGHVVRVADEDTKDQNLVNILTQKRMEWARGHAIGFDVACLGVTAASNGTTVPFTSLFKALKTTNAATSYTGDANLTVTAGATTYADVSTALGQVETSDFYSEGDMVCIAHPSFKQKIRDLLDGNNLPIFIDAMGAGAPDRLLGVPIKWTLGARTHATATSAPTGDPLLFFGNRNYIIKGDRSGPEYAVAGADTGASFLTDEHLLKMRIRRAFAVANENAFSAIQYTAS